MIRGSAIFIAATALAGCGAPLSRPAPAPLHGTVSLDYCADQMVLGLLPRADIRAVSPEADSDTAFSAPRARTIPRIRPSLEEIAALRPRYVVRMYGGASGIESQLAALGITLVQLRPANSLADVPAELTRVGAMLQVKPRASKLIAEFAGVMTETRSHPDAVRPTLLYTTPGDVTTGNDGFVGNVIHAAGFRSIRSTPGWGSLPLEAMVRRPPDAVLRAFYDSPRYRQDRWSSSAHPRLRDLTAAVPTATVPGSALACGNWLAGDALVALSRLRRDIVKTS